MTLDPNIFHTLVIDRAPIPSFIANSDFSTAEVKRSKHTHLYRWLYGYWLSSSQSPGTPPSCFPGECNLFGSLAGKQRLATLLSSRRQGATVRCSLGCWWGGNAPLGKEWEKCRDEFDICYRLFCSTLDKTLPVLSWIAYTMIPVFLLFTLKCRWGGFQNCNELTWHLWCFNEFRLAVEYWEKRI